MDCSTPGFPVLHHLSELAQTHVHWVSDITNRLILYCPLLLLPSIFPITKIFSNDSALHISWSKYWSLASASVLPMNVQDLFPFGWTGWISLQSKGPSRVFSNTQFKNISSLALSLVSTYIYIYIYMCLIHFVVQYKLTQHHKATEFSSVQSLSRVWLFDTPWIAAHQASLSITNSRSLLKATKLQ